MTTVNEDTGRILWSTESKYYLLRLIKENSVIISPDVSAETMTKKEEAWVGIEESFAADGMPCQLSKLKRLWKRMKDTARQNMLKYNAQMKDGQRNVKVPTELDLEVAEMIALRNLNKKNAKRNKSKQMLKQRMGSTTTSALFLRPKTDILPKQEPAAAVTTGDEEEHSDFGDYDEEMPAPLPQQQQLHHHRHQPNNGYHDALEPVTILEELDSKTNDESPSNASMEVNTQSTGNAVPIDDRLGSDIRMFSGDSSSKQLQHVLMMQEIKLRELQRVNEEERMDNERELYRKRSQLLDLQIKKANLELSAMGNAVV